jgi:ATP-binding cassette subfamily C (CFTR/MRP) protein 1
MSLGLELTAFFTRGIDAGGNVLGSVAAIVVATKGAFLVPLVPLSMAYNRIQKWFRKTSTELQRVTKIANSPIFADFSQTLSGTSTIRAYRAKSRFFNRCKSSFDKLNASYVLVQLVGYWLALRLDIMGGFVGGFIGAVALYSRDYDCIPAGWLGLSLTYAFEITFYLKFVVQMIANIEGEMASVERILYYSNHIEPEAPAELPGQDPSQGEWPTKGGIRFEHVSMRYRDGPLVLEDISLKIKGGEKIGVCGRTGSGKSSLMTALFRICEIESGDGRILIDRVDTREMGTLILRENVSIIPQDPVLFCNNVRYNLDPTDRADDAQMWTALAKVRMDEVVKGLPGGLGLDAHVSEGGENFSQGQRQLICIARALLRQSKILVLDEATASIDNETDAVIQTMIQRNFIDTTVLTIAHRLNTIMDSDRVLVLDEGRVAEFDSPAALLQKDDGHFRALVEKGKSSSETSHPNNETQSK